MMEKAANSYHNDLESTSSPCDYFFFYKWKAFGLMARQSRSGGLHKITARLSRHQLWKIQANSVETSAVLQGSMANVGMNMHTTTVQQILNGACLHGRMPRKKPLLTKKHRLDSTIPTISPKLRCLLTNHGIVWETATNTGPLSGSN